jgi:hypothetical protein
MSARLHEHERSHENVHCTLDAPKQVHAEGTRWRRQSLSRTDALSEYRGRRSTPTVSTGDRGRTPTTTPVTAGLLPSAVMMTGDDVPLVLDDSGVPCAGLNSVGTFPHSDSNDSESAAQQQRKFTTPVGEVTRHAPPHHHHHPTTHTQPPTPTRTVGQAVHSSCVAERVTATCNTYTAAASGRRRRPTPQTWGDPSVMPRATGETSTPGVTSRRAAAQRRGRRVAHGSGSASP